MSKPMLEAFCQSQGMFLDQILQKKSYPELSGLTFAEVASHLDNTLELLEDSVSMFNNLELAEFVIKQDVFEIHVNAAIAVYTKVVYLCDLYPNNQTALDHLEPYKLRILRTVIVSPIAIQFWTKILQKKIDPNLVLEIDPVISSPNPTAPTAPSGDDLSIPSTSSKTPQARRSKSPASSSTNPTVSLKDLATAFQSIKGACGSETRTEIEAIPEFNGKPNG